MATYWDIINRNDLTPEQKAQEIQAIGELERKQIDRENLGAKARIGLGATLQGVSALPVFNIPYVGTGLGGALFETGNAIMQGKNKEDIAKDAGTGFVVGETVGAIPYVGKAAAKTKAGQAVGNQASKLFNYLTDTKLGQKVAEIAPKVEDLLMTDIKAFNPNKQTAYHGSPYDFNKFSNEAIGTGEGAQAHGMGHYAAVNKNVAEGYRQRLGGFEYDGNPVLMNSEKDLLINEILDDGYNNTLSKYQKQLDELDEVAKMWEHSPNDYNEVKRIANEVENKINIINDIDTTKIKRSSGQLYKLSIPKDDVMLREDLPFSEQPLKVQENFKKLYSDYSINSDADYSLQKIMEKDYKGKDLYNILVHQEINKQYPFGTKEYRINRINPEFEKNASNLLNQHGIKGISYNGGIDGEARVIFNPDDIDIVRKYYNQPELFQKLTGQTPNTGAVASNLYEYLKN